MSEIENRNDTIKLLLVDDQPIVAESVKKMIADEPDFEFHYCREPAEAVSKAEEINPTLILQDLQMEGVDGLTLVKFYRVRESLENLPIIVFTSTADAKIKRRLFEAGANDYLVKGTDKIELVARIRLHVKHYRLFLDNERKKREIQESEKHLKSELKKAGDYCMSLLPKKIEEKNAYGLSIDWRFIPSEQLGGDNFDYNALDDDKFAIYLLDVCGHGVGAALMSVSALNQLRSGSLPNADFADPASVCEALNKAYQMSDHGDKYFTFWYGVFDKNTREINFASAGHPPSTLILPDGSVDMLGNDNFVIGGLPEFPFTASKTQAPEGSSLYVYSDGVYELEKPNGEMWTLNEFRDFIVENKKPGGKEMDELYLFAQKMTGTEILDDDFSIMRVDF